MPRRRNRHRSSPTSAGSTLTRSSAPSQRVTVFDLTTRISNDEIDPRLLTSITDKLRAANLLSRPTQRVFRLRKASSPESIRASELSAKTVQKTDCETFATTRSTDFKKKTPVWVPLTHVVQPSSTVGTDLSYTNSATMSDKSTSDGGRSTSGSAAASSRLSGGNSKQLCSSRETSTQGSKLDDGFTVVTRKKRRG